MQIDCQLGLISNLETMDFRLLGGQGGYLNAAKQCHLLWQFGLNRFYMCFGVSNLTTDEYFYTWISMFLFLTVPTNT